MKIKITKQRLAFLAISIIAVSSVVVVYSQSGSKNEGAGKGEVRITVEGELQVKDAASDDSVGKYVFKVKKAVVEDGSELTELKDETLHFLDNAKSKELIKRHSKGEKLVIRGGIYLREKVLIVRAFKKAEPDGAASRPQGSGSK